ncbi:MAG: fatty-acid synthase [Cyanothece sp. SIO2G6]|nr:fatty-acid synthase [Cyanothece sp. SIO2G6]
MPAKDFYHDTVKVALVKDGWTITDDPLTIAVGGRDLFVDFGAEKLLIAQRRNQKIAVEVKSFLSPSPVSDLELALGQYLVYEDLMRGSYPDYLLYLAVPQATYITFFQEELVQIVIDSRKPKLLIFDEKQEIVTRWQPPIQ